MIMNVFDRGFIQNLQFIKVKFSKPHLLYLQKWRGEKGGEVKKPSFRIGGSKRVWKGVENEISISSFTVMDGFLRFSFY